MEASSRGFTHVGCCKIWEEEQWLLIACFAQKLLLNSLLHFHMAQRLVSTYQMFAQPYQDM
jgi:hypothetical protein